MGPASFDSATFSTRRSRSCAFATVHNLHIQHVRGFSLFRFDKKKVADSVKIGFQCYTPQVFDYSLVFFFFSSRNRDFGIDFCFSRPPPSSSTAAVSNFIFLFCCCCWCALAVALPSPRSSFLPPPPLSCRVVVAALHQLELQPALGGCEAPETRRGPGGVACCIVGVGWGMILTCRERFRRASPPR